MPAVEPILERRTIPSRPFGEAACEAEIRKLGPEYQKYFFYHTAFNDDAVRPDVYLIIGRRGSGKTALGHYFAFQQRLKQALAIDVDEPAVYQDVLRRLAMLASTAREVAIPLLARIWEFVIWTVIFRELKDKDRRIREACLFEENGPVCALIKTVIDNLLSFFKTETPTDIEVFLAKAGFQDAKAAVLEWAQKHPVIVAFDTLENYDVEDEAMIRATTALIECASRFNNEFSRKNIHLKLFVMAEVFPYIVEDTIGNTLKHVRDEIYLHWRPKDLMRLISWRLYRCLVRHDISRPRGEVTDWEDHREVADRMWTPFFGEKITNVRGFEERTFPYILRHTQLRPRQLIVLCNAIAKRALQERTFPHFTPAQICEGVRQGERELAKEVLNSYATVYPDIGHIVEALSASPVMFPGKELDKRAPFTASAWREKTYSALRFTKLVAELGIVGRVRRYDPKSGFVEADFEYAMEDRLPLLTDSQCVIHPMFFGKLHTKVEPAVRVYPFPDHPHFHELEQL